MLRIKRFYGGSKGLLDTRDCYPSNYDKAMAFEKTNGNTKWRDMTRLEMEQLFEYIYSEAPSPEGYNRIRGD